MLAARLSALGAEVVETPAIRIEALAQCAPPPAGFDLICFTVPPTAVALFRALDADARALAAVTVAAIGPGTAAEPERHGIRADVLPERFVAEGLLDGCRDGADRPRARGARGRGARRASRRPARSRREVEVLALYDTVPEPLSAAQLEERERAT